MDTTVMAAILAELGFCQEEIEEMTRKEDPGESCDCQDEKEPADCNQTDSRTSTTNNSTTGGTI